MSSRLLPQLLTRRCLHASFAPPSSCSRLPASLPPSCAVHHHNRVAQGEADRGRLRLPLHQRQHAAQAARQGHPAVPGRPADHRWACPPGPSSTRDPSSARDLSCLWNSNPGCPRSLLHRHCFWFRTPTGLETACMSPPPPCCPTSAVFLLSMRAGAVGINLTAASHVFLMVGTVVGWLHCRQVGGGWQAAGGMWAASSGCGWSGWCRGCCSGRGAALALRCDPALDPTLSCNPPRWLAPPARAGACAEPRPGGAGHRACLAHGAAAQRGGQEVLRQGEPLLLRRRWLDLVCGANPLLSACFAWLLIAAWTCQQGWLESSHAAPGAALFRLSNPAS